MNRLLTIVVTIIVAEAVCSCKHKSRIETEIIRLSGQTIVFPEGYEIISQHDSSEVSSIITDSTKIVTYFPDIPCTECILNMLYDWQDEVKHMDIPFVLVVDSCNEEELRNGISEYEIDIHIIMYHTGIFNTTNELNVMARNRTFLLDKDNTILIVGEPFRNDRMKELYDEAMKQL